MTLTHTPKPVCEDDDASVSRNQRLHSLMEVVENRQNIGLIIKNKKEKVHTVICGNTSRVEYHTKESEKLNKYKSLCVETKRMWNMK